MAGRVGRLEVTVGNLVAAGPGAPVLTTLVSVSPIYASFDADEQVVAQALKDLPAAAARARSLERIPVQMGTAASADTPFEGQLQLVDNQVDAKSGTVRVRAVFDNPDGSLMPGQFAALRMGQATGRPARCWSTSAPSAPTRTRSSCMVVGADNKAAYREVTLGAAVDGLRVVTDGPEGRRAHRRQRPAARAPRRAGRAAAWCADGDCQAEPSRPSRQVLSPTTAEEEPP